MFRSILPSLRLAASHSGRRLVSNGFRTFAQNQNKSKKFLTAGAATLVFGTGLIAGGLNAASSVPDYSAIRAKVAKIIEDEPSHGPLLIRLAWHASGTYNKDTKTGGSNGATMRFPSESQHGANAGLQIARALLEPIKKAHPEISYSDLWTLAGSVAVEELGGPTIQWRPGRSDSAEESDCPPDGRLPAADKGHPKITAKHVRDIFYRMGFNDKEIVALLGAHAVGRCHPDRSGYVGPWTRAETSFSNEYFRELIENKWTKKNWNGPEQYEDPTGFLMMLPADMVLIQDPEFRKYTEMYAKDQGKFFKDFSRAFQKLMELGAPVQKGWFGWLFG